jgi:hypothetical protein
MHKGVKVTMSLNVKRNLPIMALLMAYVILLMVAIGEQPIVAGVF